MYPRGTAAEKNMTMASGAAYCESPYMSRAILGPKPWQASLYPCLFESHSILRASQPPHPDVSVRDRIPDESNIQSRLVSTLRPNCRTQMNNVCDFSQECLSHPRKTIPAPAKPTGAALSQRQPSIHKMRLTTPPKSSISRWQSVLQERN